VLEHIVQHCRKSANQEKHGILVSSESNFQLTGYGEIS
jgi:hypothetical protein